jgi:protein-arginine kinase
MGVLRDFFYILAKRLKNQERQIDLQINQRVDGRFNSAIGLLGSSETSARTGAVYALHELALEEEKYRQQIAQILCSHKVGVRQIRSRKFCYFCKILCV